MLPFYLSFIKVYLFCRLGQHCLTLATYLNPSCLSCWRIPTPQILSTAKRLPCIFIGIVILCRFPEPCFCLIGGGWKIGLNVKSTVRFSSCLLIWTKQSIILRCVYCYSKKFLLLQLVFDLLKGFLKCFNLKRQEKSLRGRGWEEKQFFVNNSIKKWRLERRNYT